MIDSLPNSVLAWLLTYAVHSTILLGLAWCVSRRAAMLPSARDFIWKAALVGGVITATAQLTLNVRPNGSIALRGAVAGASAAASNPSRPGREVSADRRAGLTDDAPLTAPSSEARELSNAPIFSWSNAEQVIVVAWAIVALLLAAAYVARRLILMGRLIDRQVVSSGAVPAMLDDMRRSIGYRGHITLTAASTISSPVALGLSEICVPAAALTDLDAEQQRGLLAHELAHLARRDPLWLDCASVIERVFFFQPLNRLARREMQHAAEYLCDDWAAARIGSGLPLAKCLARVAEWIQLSPLGVPMAGMAEQRSMLVSRIARLVEGRAEGAPMPRAALIALAAPMLVIMVAAAPGVQRLAPATPDRAPGAPSARAKDARHVGASDAPKIVGIATHDSAMAPEDTAVVNALIERLKDSDASVRKAAANALGNMNSRRAVPALIAALDDKNHEVRAAAADALGNIQDPASAHALAKLLTDSSPDVRERALDALSNFSHDVPMAPVIAALSDARPNIRATAAHLLAEIGDPEAVAPLTRLLKDSSPHVRQQAVDALKELKDPSSAPALLALVHDDNADVRAAVLSALRELGAPISERALLDALADDAADVRSTAASLAGEGKVVVAVPLLRHLIEDPSADVREQAIDALSRIRTPAARDALKAALKSSDAQVRLWATEALGSRP